MALDPQTLPGSTWRPMRGPFTRWPRGADTVLAIVVFLLSVFVSSNDADQDLAFRALNDIPISTFFVFGVASAALYWRRSQPLIVLGVALTAKLAVLMGLVGYPDLWALPVALYSVPLCQYRRDTYPMLN